MKDYIYPIIISVLMLCLVGSMYTLYSKKEVQVNTNIVLNETKTVDILEVKTAKTKRIVKNKPKIITKTNIKTKEKEIKKLLDKTEKMLKAYNLKNNKSIIINNSAIDKLVHLDLKQSDILNIKSKDETPSDDTKVDEAKIEATNEQSQTNTNNRILTASATITSTQTTSEVSLDAEQTSSEVLTSSEDTITNETEESQTTTTASSTTQTATSTTQTTTNSQSNNQITAEEAEVVTLEKTKLQTQIDDVRKIIEEVSLN